MADVVTIGCEIIDRLDRTILNPTVFARNFERALEPAIERVAEEGVELARSITRGELRSDGRTSSDPGFLESWHEEHHAAGFEFNARIWNSAPYARYVEAGRDPGGDKPPYSMIYAYLEAHGDFEGVELGADGDVEKARKRFTFATMGAIARDGIAPKNIRLELGLVFTRLRISRIMQAEIDKHWRVHAY